MEGSDEGAWLFQLKTQQLLSCLDTFRVALVFLSFKTGNERGNPKSASITDINSDQNVERNGDFNIENVLFIFHLISYIHFYGNSVFWSFFNIQTLNYSLCTCVADTSTWRMQFRFAFYYLFLLEMRKRGLFSTEPLRFHLLIYICPIAANSVLTVVNIEFAH